MRGGTRTKILSRPCAHEQGSKMHGQFFRLAERVQLPHGIRMFDPVEKLKEFIRHPSVSTDSKFRDGMKGAQEFVSSLLKSLGFTVDVVPTELHPIIFA